MLTLTSRKSLTISVVILASIVVFFILPVKFEYRIKVQGKILPAKEWLMYKGTDGRLTSVLTDYKSGINQSYNVTLFDRGDEMQFTFSPNLRSGLTIKNNDTIAVVYSNEIERQIENLKGQISSAKASLSLNITGEKESIIQQEANNLEYAKKQAEEQKKVLDRIESLYKKGFASQAEYDVAKSTYDLDVINISISEAKLKAAQTGSKEEQINYIKSQIEALEKELTVLQKRREGFTLLSPIDGIVNRKTNSDTLLIISDTSQFVVLSPIRVQDLKFVNPHQKVELYINNSNLGVTANIIEINNSVQVLNGFQVVTALSELNDRTQTIFPGLLIECYINTGSLSPFQYFLRTLQRFVN